MFNTFYFVTFCHRSNITHACIGLTWNLWYKHWVWEWVPYTYNNWGPHVSIPPLYGFHGFVSTEDGWHWEYDKGNNKHHYICQSLDGEIYIYMYMVLDH